MGRLSLLLLLFHGLRGGDVYGVPLGVLRRLLRLLLLNGGRDQDHPVGSDHGVPGRRDRLGGSRSGRRGRGGGWGWGRGGGGSSSGVVVRGGGGGGRGGPWGCLLLLLPRPAGSARSSWRGRACSPCWPT